jgi:hypothetical protein
MNPQFSADARGPRLLFALISKRTFKSSDCFRKRRLVRPLVPAKRIGAGEGTRTRNLRITNPPLYQLSYASLEPIAGTIDIGYPAGNGRERPIPDGWGDFNSSGLAPADGLEEHHRGGRGHVQGAHPSYHRNPDPVIQQLEHTPPNPAALGPEYQNQVPLPDPIPGLEEILPGLGVGPDDPEPPILQLSQGPPQVADPTDGKMLDCAGTRSSHRSPQGRRAAGGQHQAQCPGGLRHPDDGAEILGILDPIEGDEASSTPRWSCERLELLQGRRG